MKVRQQVAALVICSLTLSGVAPAVAGTTWRPKLGPAIRWSGERQGEVTFTVKDTRGRLHMHRGRTKAPMASTLKVMFMVA